MDQAPRSFVSQAVECQLTLLPESSKGLAGDTKRSEVNTRVKTVLAEKSGQSAVDPIDLRDQQEIVAEIAPQPQVAKPSLSMEFTDPHNLLVPGTENDEGQQSLDLTMRRGLFWPFNRQDLTVDFSVSLNGDGARFRSFLSRAPVGQIKGRWINNE